jgi:hypothetical protein
MKSILVFPLRLLFWPIGAILLGGTAVYEFICQFPNWDYWRRYNADILYIMWLKRSADPTI